METNDVIGIVKGILSDLSGVAHIRDDHPLGRGRSWDASLGLDSLDKLEAIMQFEEAFGIDIPDVDVDHRRMATPAGIAAYIAERLARSSAA